MTDKMGIWACGICGDEKVLPEATVVARCVGVWQVTYMGCDMATTHWPEVCTLVGVTDEDPDAPESPSVAADLSRVSDECWSGSDGTGDALGAPMGSDEWAWHQANVAAGFASPVAGAAPYGRETSVERLFSAEDRARFGAERNSESNTRREGLA